MRELTKEEVKSVSGGWECTKQANGDTKCVPNGNGVSLGDAYKKSQQTKS